MSLKKVLLAATILALPMAAVSTAQAQPVSGVYVGAGAGVNFLQKTDADIGGAAASSMRAGGLGTSGKASFDTGYAGVLSIGYGFGNGVRAEVEGNFRSNDVDKFGGLRATDGKARSYGAMFNALYDFNLGLPIIPYIGGGIGYVWTDYQNVRGNTAAGGRVALDGDDGQFAYQGIVGASLPIEAVPGLSLTAEYRFLGTLQSSVDASYRTPAGVSTRGKADVDTYNHSILLGLRYAFGVAPAPVPVMAPVQAVAPAPAPARTYLVFFDFDRADLTDRARQITSEAAQNSKVVQVTRIEVSGHADRSGTPQYNQALSMRRATAVAAELQRLGVDRSQITVQAFGESRPLVPTADGVREPQNRRVEIVLR